MNLVSDPETPLEPSDEGSPRPPTKVPGVWNQMPVLVRVGLVALLLVAAGGVVLVSRQESQSSTNLDGGIIEQLIPADGAKAPQQTQIGIDLAEGYNASLSVNGQPIPDDQLDRIQAFNQVLFQPGPGKEFEKWDATVPTCVTATYWTYASPAQTTLRTWCFSVV